jgi:hypothetical protein
MSLVVGFVIQGIIGSVLPVVGIAIAGAHWNSCGTSKTDPTISNTLNLWIIIFCAVSEGALIFTIVSRALIGRMQAKLPSGKKALLSLVMLWLILSILFNLFAIAWIVYGGTLLFGSVGAGCYYIQNVSGVYTGYPVWQMAMAVWIILLISSVGFLIFLIVTAITSVALIATLKK